MGSGRHGEMVNADVTFDAIEEREMVKEVCGVLLTCCTARGL